MKLLEVYLDPTDLVPLDSRLIAAFTNAEVERVFNTRFLNENLATSAHLRRELLRKKIIEIRIEVTNLGTVDSQEETEVEQLRR